jgi:GNAT superfamily N-acetyltransferase
MVRISKQQRLTDAERLAVDQLIRESWAFESLKHRDVTMAPNHTPLSDPLDQKAIHILARDAEGRLLGYGRVSIAYTADELSTTFAELGVGDSDFPVAYISRLVVKPEARHQGIANLIRHARIEAARLAGARTIYAWAVGAAPKASLLRLGFKERISRQGFKTGYYETRRTATLVMMSLDSRANTGSLAASGH